MVLKKDKLYRALDELDKAGLLFSKKITNQVIDTILILQKPEIIDFLKQGVSDKRVLYSYCCFYNDLFKNNITYNRFVKYIKYLNEKIRNS